MNQNGGGKLYLRHDLLSKEIIMIDYSNVTTIYVSQQEGDINYTGFSPQIDEIGNGPLKTVEQAIEKVCQLRSGGIFRPMTIQIMDDEYFLDNTLEFNAGKISEKFKDNECLISITVEPYKDRCKIVGGKKLKGFKEDIFNGTKCFSLFIPEVKNGEWNFTDLYVDGRRAKLTRYPEKGTLRCVDTEHNEGGIFTHSKWFIAKKEDLENISDVESAIVSYYHYWVDEHSPIESYDKNTGKLVMAYKSRFLISNQYEEDNEENGQHNTANLEYYLENIAEMFKNPDEWYLETKTGMLYYIPRNDEQTTENITVYAPTTDKIIDVCGNENYSVKNIRFRNIDFVCSKGDYASTSMDISEFAVEGDKYASDSQAVSDAYGAINFRYANNCSIENCILKNLGIQAVSVENGCADIRIEGCEISDIGAGGIRIFGGAYGCDKKDETHHITVRNCKISYCGRRYAAGCGVLANHTYCNEFTDNEISYLDYSGISVGWVWGYGNSNTYDNIIRRNHIHHIGMGNLSDMGGIYLLGRQKGTIIAENVIHDVICRHYGGWGIYTDEGSSFVTVEKNRVYNCSSDCYHQHYGNDNVIRNNIFAFGGSSVVRCSIDEYHPSIILEGNILLTDGKPIYTTGAFNKGFNSALASQNNIIYDVSGVEPCIFICNNKKFTLDEVQKMGLETGTVVKDPKIDDLYHEI